MGKWLWIYFWMLIPSLIVSFMTNNTIVQALPGLDRRLQSQMEEAGVRQEVIDAYKEAGGLPYLDNRYTVFGQVYEGMDVVDAIAAVDTDENDKPTEDVLIEKVELAVYSTSAS